MAEKPLKLADDAAEEIVGHDTGLFGRMDGGLPLPMRSGSGKLLQGRNNNSNGRGDKDSLHGIFSIGFKQTVRVLCIGNF